VQASKSAGKVREDMTIDKIIIWGCIGAIERLTALVGEHYNILACMVQYLNG
jgi:hypothetical protein